MTAITAEAVRICARHAALPIPADLRDDARITEVSTEIGRVAAAFMAGGRLAPSDVIWLREVRPELHSRFLAMHASSERGYVESLLAVVDTLLSVSRLV